MVDSHEMWWHVKHLLALHVEILENLLLIMWFERRKDFAVRTEFEIDGDLEFGELKWRGESVTLVMVNSFLHETPGRWSVDTEGNLRGVSKTRGDLCLKFNKFVAIFDDPVKVRQRFRSVKESSTKQSQNSNEVIMTLESIIIETKFHKNPSKGSVVKADLCSNSTYTCINPPLSFHV